MYSQSYQFQDYESVLREGEAIQDICNFGCRYCNHFLKATEREATLKHIGGNPTQNIKMVPLYWDCGFYTDLIHKLLIKYQSINKTHAYQNSLCLDQSQHILLTCCRALTALICGSAHEKYFSISITCRCSRRCYSLQ